ncbi:MAG: phosphatidylglycerol lysyltransferase domain-containing protein [Propionibacteriaceae bacterium]|nr:phosphatidylglycerol lysyltransferase domain-containing protein [Propionibacteriaceae bacterium]
MGGARRGCRSQWQSLWPAFTARVGRGSWLAALGIVAGGVALAVAVTAVLVRLWPGSTAPAWLQTAVSLLRSLGIHPPAAWREVQVAHLVLQVASFIMGAALVGAVLVFLRSRRSPDAWHPANEVAVRELLAQFGENDSLGYVATRRDRLVHFDSRRRAAVSYQVFGGVALAGADPIGDPLAWEEAVTRWEAHVRPYGWTPAVMACSPEAARVYSRALGFEVLRLGDEAILSPESFRIDSTSLTEVRRAWQRATREGMVADFRTQAELDPEALS